MLTDKVLILNRSWVPVNVSTVRRALILVYLDVARIVEPADFSTYGFEDWIQTDWNGRCNGTRLRSANFEIRLPEVIVLKAFNGLYLKEVRASRRSILERDGHICQYCGSRHAPGELTLDHIVPRSRGGESTWENIVVACLKCNSRKGDRLPKEAGMRLLNQPVKPKWATRLGLKLGRRPKRSWSRFLNDARANEAVSAE